MKKANLDCMTPVKIAVCWVPIAPQEIDEEKEGVAFRLSLTSCSPFCDSHVAAAVPSRL